MSAESKIAAVYLRVSTSEQTEFSPDAQLSAIREFAARGNYVIVPEYIFADEGISGRRAEKRPAFMRMVTLAKQKPSPFDTILVHKIDRFARSREDSVVYKSLLRKECNVKVVSVTENIEDDKFSVILEAMLEAMAEYYSLNLSDEVKKGMTEKAKRGGLQSAPSFGYAAKDNVLTPIPEEMETVRQIFERFNAGEGYYHIARGLNETGVKTRRGNNFEHRTVEYIIRNPVYIGKLRWNPSGKTKRGDYGNPDILVVDGGHEPIIGMDVWTAAQQRASAVKAQWKRHMRPIAEHKDWISGLVRCAACGGTLIQSGSLYWKCGRFAKGACGTSQHIADEKLKSKVLECLRLEFAGLSPFEYTRISSSADREYEMLNSRLTRIGGKLRRIQEAYINGVDSLDDYKAAKAVIEKERGDIQYKIKELKAIKISGTIIGIKDEPPDVAGLLKSTDTPISDKHRMAHEAIKEIIFNKEKNTIKIVYLLA